MTTEAKTAPLPTILFNKAAYTNGDDVILNISNKTDKITSVTVSHLGTEIQKLDHLDATSVKLSSDIFSPNSGYVVKVETVDNTGNHTSKTLGLSVEDDWTVFPRYGVVAGSNDNSAERNNSMTNDQLAGYQNNIEQLAQMHINNYFFYDVYDTTSNPFPNVNSFKQEWATWAVDNGQPNPPQIDTLLIKNLVNKIHEKGGSAMLYNMLNAASNDELDNPAIKNILNNVKLYNAQEHSNFGKAGAETKTSVQQFVDPADKSWQNYIVNTMIKALKTGGFDGWQADTMGDNLVYKIQNGQKTENFRMSDGYDDLSAAAAEKLHDYGQTYMINDISTGRADVLSTTGMDVPYSEIWPRDFKDTAGNTHYENHNYAELKRLVGRLYDYNHISPIIAAYTQKGTHPEDHSSELNPDNELLVDAVIAASGGYHMTVAALNNHPDKNAHGFGILQDPYYPAQTLKTNETLAKSEFNYQQFITAYEELLRGEGLVELKDSHASIVASDGYDMTSTSGEGGKVYTWTKATADGGRVVQLINLAGLDKDTNWNSSNHHTLKLDNPKVRIPFDMEISAEQAEQAIVQLASPDSDDISMHTLESSVIYENGKPVALEVTVPSLDVWDMLYVSNLGQASVSQTFADGKTTFNGTHADDHIKGTESEDIIYGNRGNDEIHGGSGNDKLSGGTGDDVINGDAGSDILYGGGGNDHLNGGLDNDTLYGGAGNDTLLGEAGNDILHGGAGNDTLFGGLGDDILRGEAGNDTYVFNRGEGHDTIFNHHGTNAIQFGAGISLSDLSLETVNEQDGTTWNITIRGENNHNDLITIDHQYSDIHTDAQGQKIPSVSEFRFDEGTFNIDQLMHILG